MPLPRTLPLRSRSPIPESPQRFNHQPHICEAIVRKPQANAVIMGVGLVRHEVARQQRTLEEK